MYSSEYCSLELKQFISVKNINVISKRFHLFNLNEKLIIKNLIYHLQYDCKYEDILLNSFVKEPMLMKTRFNTLTCIDLLDKLLL